MKRKDEKSFYNLYTPKRINMNKLQYIPYSFSKIATFYQCPQKFKLRYKDKIFIKSDNIALEKGSYIHHCIENNIMDNEITPFKFRLSSEENIKEYNNIVRTFFNSDLYKSYKNLPNKKVEEGFSLSIIDKKIIPGSYKKDSLVRGYIDFMSLAEDGKSLLIVDWKTGKFKEDINQLQVQIYALWAFYTFPEVYTIDTTFCFVEHSKMVNKQFTRDDINDIKKNVLSHILGIEKAQEFKKNVSALCDYCEFKQNGYCDGKFESKWVLN
jgi:hypothetical protein